MRYLKAIIREQYPLFLIWFGFYASAIVAMIIVFHGWTWLYAVLAFFVAINVIHYTIFVIVDTKLFIEWLQMDYLIKRFEEVDKKRTSRGDN